MKTTFIALQRAYFVIVLFLSITFTLHATVLSYNLECPPSVTVYCNDDLSDLDKWGKAWVWENYIKKYTLAPKSVIYNTNSCGIGTITRTWEYEDPHWIMHTCTQTIKVISNGLAFGLADINWPLSLELEGCNPNADPSLLPKFYNVPTFNKKSCSQPMYSYKDMKFTVGDGCMKILRDWKVIDWCQYVPNAKPQLGVWTYTQVIKLVLKDSTAKLNCPKDTIVDANQDCKGAFVKLDSATAFSKCGAIYKITNTSPYAKSSGANASGTYPLGTTQFYFIAEYGCGKELKCLVTVTVKNKIPPTPYCLTGVIVALMPIDTNRDGTVDVGMIEVWAKDVDHGSYHPCGYKNLRFSFSKDVNDRSRIFSCDQLGKNDIEMWVTDSFGNQSFCRTMIEIQNNNARIPNCKRKDSITTNPSSLSVNGTIHRENLEFIEEVKLQLADMSSFTVVTKRDTVFKIKYDTLKVSSGTVYYIQKKDTLISVRYDTIHQPIYDEKMNRSDGSYAFLDLKKNRPYILQPSKTNQSIQGIDINDVIVLLRYIMGVEKWNSPYKRIAADINGDGIISNADFDLLYSVVNGSNTINAIPKLWRFVPKSYIFPDPINPSKPAYPESVGLSSMNHSMNNLDFIAIRIGELDGSKTYKNLNSETVVSRNQSTAIAYVTDQKLLNNKTYNIPITFEKPISGGIFKSNSNFEILEISDPYQSYPVRDGIIYFNKSNQSTTQIVIKIKALQTIELSVILKDINATILHAQQEENVKFAVMSNKSNEHLDLIRVYPNPIKNEKLRFDFNLPIATDVILEFSNLQGLEMYRTIKHFESGQQSWEIDPQKIGNIHAGMIFFKISDGSYFETGKLFLEK
ncbi:MAG: dockerin type I repeat-containing protein [Saprospiraceae bacterium]|jgi:hypothetical protein|nr:dockerin type I repeat-containing protein [Saprospiraceae bacterium]